MLPARHQESLCWVLSLAAVLTGFLLIYCVVHSVFFNRLAGSNVAVFRHDLDRLQGRLLRLREWEQTSWEAMESFQAELTVLPTGGAVSVVSGIRQTARRRPHHQFQSFTNASSVRSVLPTGTLHPRLA
ncbi:hypothetical protein BV898_03470 [Hypsibius exemplaris]|uniref:Uncharacterized protein n=1 Tax=Hypsibius exemplaris TaxID=2072580 RepID=A0A1W0X583_HYPEX|nr:hypothetical protein BV898_03470 [Hypsibius exemplaris]